ncbi:MAG TPA: preprotein translocase subunit SecY [Solirubrobacteraceae bacterium]|nr:preprotein translocase subunit SecY [Solirubrobacteraceae bacterium]
MLATIFNAFRVPEIRRKLAFTAALLALYRFGSFIPVPGVDTNALEAIEDNYADGGILNFLNMFSGGGLSRIAIFALGIMPYITASIILQLLTVVSPSLEKLQKEGEVGQARITQYTRYLTVGLSGAQAVGYVFLFRSQGNAAGAPIIPNFNIGTVLLIVICLTAGCVLLMWMGELITQRGIGNGISLMIFASIVAGLPQGIQAWYTNSDKVFVVIMPFMALGIIAAIVFIQEGQRRIPVQYAKRVIGRRMSGGGQTYLPLRVNMAGVIPVIFAASIMAFPPTVGQLVPGAQGLANFFNPSGWAYIAGETVFIILFCYFYTAVTFNPVDQADNLKKYGGFIPGVRPGRPTAEFLDRILARLTFPGALYLASVAALPTILINQTSANFYFGGTSILIVVGVALDTMKQLEAQLMMRNYEGFLK